MAYKGKNTLLNYFSTILPSSLGRVKESKTDIPFSWLMVILSLWSDGGKKSFFLDETWEAVEG